MPLAFARFARAVSVVLCIWALPALAIGSPDAPPAIRYALTAWSTEQSGDVLAIAQDLEGYLWLGTPDGPVRFDGTRFQKWPGTNGGIPARYVAALAASAQGGLWAGFGGTGGVARILRGSTTPSSPSDGAPLALNALLEDRRGTLWAATVAGLFRYAANRWSRVTAADGYEGEQAYSVYEDRAGRVWVGAARGPGLPDRSRLAPQSDRAVRRDASARDGDEMPREGRGAL